MDFDFGLSFYKLVSVRLSHFLVNHALLGHSYVLQATRAFLGVLPFWFIYKFIVISGVK